MSRLVIDIEADGLLQTVTRTWIIGSLDLDTREVKWWLDGDLGWKEYFDKCDIAVGHNICAYDEMVLRKLFNYRFPATTRVQDTMIMSLILNYNRFPQGRHSLENWGELLGSPKIDFHDWSHFSEEMLTYWKQDLVVTEKVYEVVSKEFRQVASTSKTIGTYLRAEGAVARWCAMAELYGWPFDVAAAVPLLEQMEAERKICSDKLMPRLGTKTVAVDKAKGVVPSKKPKYLKDGRYDIHTCNWFGVDEYSAYDDIRPIEGEYSRITFEDLDINSVADVKIFLFRHGWVPTEWNTKPNPLGRGRIQTSPKITEDSLECMEGDGKLYCDFLTTSSRAAILKGWLKNVDSSGRLHGTCFPIGTPSFRARHSGIVNVPSADSRWGPEMRALFITTPGWTMVGTDSSGNQARGLAHYLKSPEYIDLVLHGDIHTFNAKALDTVLNNMGISWDKYLLSQGVAADDKHTLAENIAKKKRGVAKRVLYAFLFGASGAKLWGYIFGKGDDLKGKKLRLGFMKAVPGFKALSDKLENIYGKTKQYGDGYIPGITGNKIYCDSFHKLLVYLLQACEKATCSCSTMLTMQRLEAAGIPYQPLIFYHDEIDYMVPDEYAEKASAISKQTFSDSPKLMGIDIMDGESKIGRNWLEVH